MSQYFWQEDIQYGGIGAYRIVGTAGCVEVTLLLLGFWLQWSPLLQFGLRKQIDIPAGIPAATHPGTDE